MTTFALRYRLALKSTGTYKLSDIDALLHVGHNFLLLNDTKKKN